MVRLLLEAGADPGDGGDEPALLQVVKWAFLTPEKGMRILRLLLDAGADPNQRHTPKPHAIHHHETALQAAAGDGNFALVCMLLRAGADPTLGARKGGDALAHAAANVPKTKKPHADPYKAARAEGCVRVRSLLLEWLAGSITAAMLPSDGELLAELVARQK